MTEEPLSKIEETFLYLGFHTAYWNRAEGELDKLLICAIGDSAKAHILTSGTNAAKRASFLKAIYEECCSEESWAEVAIAAVAAFDALRKNRNVLAHGMALGLDDIEGSMDLKVKTQNNIKRTHKKVTVSRDSVSNEVRLVRKLESHLSLLRRHIYHLGGAHVEM